MANKLRYIAGGLLIGILLLCFGWLLAYPLHSLSKEMPPAQALIPPFLYFLVLLLGFLLLDVQDKSISPLEALPAAIFGVLLLPLQEVPFWGGKYGGVAVFPGEVHIQISQLAYLLVVFALYHVVWGMIRRKKGFRPQKAFALLGTLALAFLAPYASLGLQSGWVLQGVPAYAKLLVYLVQGVPFLCLLPWLKANRAQGIWLCIIGGVLSIAFVAFHFLHLRPNGQNALALLVSWLAHGIHSSGFGLYLAMLFSGVLALWPVKTLAQ